ncbi:bifunctional 4-hydroxy-2-oxoglutarate aldolase/2-dehydro-3-deoxy-phosphogluconate aldolase [Salegentibacter salegens]|uniref:2-dehydro-3-deoxyphosphogluconate aldolase / (4S)-4-hydroxy-2-oxoglutarate aldolase n=1 Tax=Salegentibacter salegens TaxID=143223 RepID=A0A1M7MEG1_9FLAO|nr:bifunctional 4-hydroxy-2-oxoglutarate aldolase/2-dehydro-3-deoxy-phosphogluconate aldolase [Salegentibacter salegens]PRX51643.1 2-dehydro-3-deoxyphosphogluconate aldolase/(4S)-4-hydroxy-2-oxoglutarate aldolase [Salegentibacter salegens]SHM89201.1 2-dehydro-3-deoxyphosphogluconate aldolase / (4S)-4-hydroxy-2-oxoglutarate aldolase [Salegentibacter salegens]
MYKYTRIEVVLEMQNLGLIPVFYHPNVNVCKKVIKACYEGGARVFEFTNRGDFAFEVFEELIKYCKDNLPGMIIGVGSIVDASTCALFMERGANFIVSPVFKEDIAILCNRRKLLWIPGCGTLTEISQAEELGCEIVKIFPGSVYGPNFVKAIKGPCPWTSIMPTGGVTISKSNLEEWFEAGVTCVGIGSKLISANILLKKDFSLLSERVNSTLTLIRNARNRKKKINQNDI